MVSSAFIGSINLNIKKKIEVYKSAMKMPIVDCEYLYS